MDDTEGPMVLWNVNQSFLLPWLPLRSQTKANYCLYQIPSISIVSLASPGSMEWWWHLQYIRSSIGFCSRSWKTWDSFRLVRKVSKKARRDSKKYNGSGVGRNGTHPVGCALSAIITVSHDLGMMSIYGKIVTHLWMTKCGTVLSRRYGKLCKMGMICCDVWWSRLLQMVHHYDVNITYDGLGTESVWRRGGTESLWIILW